jgi:hypothetical protein
MRQWYPYAALFIAAVLLLLSVRRCGGTQQQPEAGAFRHLDARACDSGADCPAKDMQPAPARASGHLRILAASTAGIGGDRVVPCQRDEQCDPAMFCQTGACVAGLLDGASCARARMCDGGHCGKGICCSAKECCRDAADCPTRHDCLDVPSCRGTRTERACQQSACVDTAVTDDNEGCLGQVAVGCGAYQDVRCELNRPAGECAQSCRDRRDCRIGNACVDRACQLGCRADSECDGDQACMNGFCMETCSTAHPCKPPFLCLPFLDRGSGSERTLEVCADL